MQLNLRIYGGAMNNMNNIPSEAVSQNTTGEQTLDSIKQTAVQNVKSIENLVNSGALTQEQGQNLMNYVTQKAFEMYTSAQNPEPVGNVLANMPEFFNKDGRTDVFDYLKNSNVDFDEDEISKISSLVEKLENSAVERYLRELEHEKTLNSENETAKQKLRANAQNAFANGAENLVFTREQIGKMSGAEFAKHERAIMDQLRKGLIK